MRARTLALVILAGASPALAALPFDLPRFAAGDLLLPCGGALLWLLALRFLPERLPRPGGAATLGLAAALAALPALVGAARLEVPITNDEQAYLLQAEIFAEGRLAEPMPAAPDLWRRRQVYEDRGRGLRFAKYPPGTSAALAPAAALGWPPLAPLLAGVLDVLLVAAIGRRLGLANAPRAALLLAVSPFFLLVQTSFQSELFTAPAVLGAYLCLLRAREAARGRSGAAWAAALGALCGWVFLARPLTGVLLAAAGAVGLFGARGRSAALAGAVAGGLPFLALFLAANAFYTGDPLRTAYDLYAHARGPWADTARTQPIDVYGRGDFFPMFSDQVARWSGAMCGVLGGVALGVWGLARLRARDGGAALLFAVAAPFVYAFHWYPGHWAYFGPLYCFESLGLLTLGAAAVLAGLPPRWSRAFVLAAAVAGLTVAAARWPAIAAESELRSAAERTMREQAPPAAVVLLPLPSKSSDPLKLWTPSRPPAASGRPALVRNVPGADMQALLRDAGLSGRPLFFFRHQGGGAGRLEPLAAAR